MKKNQKSQWLSRLKKDFSVDMQRCDGLKAKMQEELSKPNPDFDVVDAFARKIAMLCGQIREPKELDEEKKQLINKLFRKKWYRHLEWIGVTAAVLFFGIGLSIIPSIQAGRNALEIVEPTQSTTAAEAYTVETSTSGSSSEQHTATTKATGTHTEIDESNQGSSQAETPSETSQTGLEMPKRTTTATAENASMSVKTESTKHTTTKANGITKHTTARATETTKHTTTKAAVTTKQTTGKVSGTTRYTTERITSATTAKTTDPIPATTVPHNTTSPPSFTTTVLLTTMQTSMTAITSNTKPSETIVEENKPTAFIFLHSSPNKICYNIGEELDLTGVKISFGYVLINSEGVGRYYYTIQEQDIMSDAVQEVLRSGALQIDFSGFNNQVAGNQRIMVYYTYEDTVAKGGILVSVSDASASTTVLETGNIMRTSPSTTETKAAITITTAEANCTTTAPIHLENEFLCCDDKFDTEK